MATNSLAGLLREAASLHSEQPALWVGSSAITWAQLHGRVRTLARALVAHGVARGERVAVVMPHGPEALEALWAVWSLSAVAVPLDPRLPPVERERRIDLVAAVCSMTGEGLQARRSVQPEAPAAAASAQVGHLSDPALIIFTSGTTGTAKGAVLSQGALLASARQHLALTGVEVGDGWLCSLPLFHVGGLGILVRAALAGIPVALPESFSADAMAEAVRRHRLSHISLVAQTLERLLGRWEEAGSSLRLALVGGGPAPRELLIEAAGRGMPVATTYGMTETASQVAVLPPKAGRHLIGSAGWPLSLSQIKIDADGEILVRGRTLFSGYWKDEAASQEVLRGGWLHTGDIGRIGDQGELWVGVRRDDLIISGGEKVSPSEVEQVLVSFPGVLEAAVFAHADRTWGEVPWALVVAEREMDPQAVIAYCQARLSPYQVPKLVRRVTELPKGALGKVRRAELLTLAEEKGIEA